ncbi:MAG: helix-hairpin-helix domain-containing protein [Acidimicrobiia bacterium]|nr:helix-hairpin-helix domain-containing protein [Acidimicrobiia bacterium]
MTSTHRSDLQTIPGVGPSIARDLQTLGVRRVADLRGRDPERLYADLVSRHGGPIDRCVLYVFRCAVYYADRQRHRPELLKWWNWKDRPYVGRAR